ncbi:MAG: O-antigen ligase family protein [Bacteroidales bacterium]|nr:O-antigen ligase family protein [Bacteroidales bacterium]
MLLWFIIPFYFITTQIVRKKKNINKFFWVYIISFCIVIAYTLVVHSANNFSHGYSNVAMRPFYNDHTSYGAALAMFIPIIVGFVFNKENKKSYRIISGFVLVYFIIAIIFSYTRAAWVSLLGAFAVWLMLRLKINYKIVLTTVIILVGTFFIFQEQIFFKLEGNKQDSSTDFSEHIKSITNVATDASNLERINRWNSAIRMYKEKPVFGWGPGTYQFNYAPFQYSYEKTIISTNAGNMGNAHSEYLGALSESGILGMISLILILIYVFITSVKIYNKAKSKSLKILIASVICALVTYFFHGFLNNFLDTDKIAVPFWGFVAIIVAIDVYFDDFDKEFETGNKELNETNDVSGELTNDEK